jgi:Ca2+-binding EF-hand superfamily protein
MKNHALFMASDDGTIAKNNTCHFDKQDDNDCYVFDYEAAATHYGETCELAAQQKQRFWQAYEKQNKARKKFGLNALTKEEYVVLQAETKAMGEKLSQDAIAQAFAAFDTNGDGVVSVQELGAGIREILRQELVTEEHVETVMRHMDLSGDGFLQPDEFVPLNELRRRLEEAIREEEKQLSLEAREQRQAQEQQPGLLKSFLAAFRLTDEHACETNFDCMRPEVCCDFHFKKFCCFSGEKARQLQLQYATVPVPQGF